MNSKRKQFLAFSLAGIGALGAFASVSAASLPAGTPSNVRDQTRTAIKQAVTNGDYQAFIAATKNSKAGVNTITEAQFNAMVSANKLRANGDIAGAKKLLDEAGIKPPVLGKKGMHGDQAGEKGMGMQMQNLTDAQKATMTQAKALFAAGKNTEAQALLDAAGIKMPAGGHRGAGEMNSFFASLTDAQKEVMKQAHILMEAGKQTEAKTLLTNAGITLPAWSMGHGLK
ncbi:MAG: hypothetical protein WC444_02810 [Candidatus Paceibacterota bacterium]